MRGVSLLAAAVIAAGCVATEGPPATATPSPTRTAAQPAPAGPAYYVAPDGDDTAPGTIDRPWRTVAAALTRLAPGDTLYLRGGTYRERIRNPRIRPATPNAPITVAAYPGERPVIQGLLWLRDADWWWFDGISVTWDPATGQPDEHMVKFTDGRGWRFTGAEVWGARSFAAILVATSGGPEPADWVIAGNCIHDTAPTNDTNQDHLIYVNSGLDSGPGLIAGNLLFGAPNGNGVKLGGPSAGSGGAAHVTVRANTIHGTAQGVLAAWEAHHNTVERNLITHTSGPALRGFRLSGAANVVRDNAAGQVASFIFDDEGYEGFVDGGGNRWPVDPGYDHTSGCDGFHPTGEAAAYGHTTWDGGADTIRWDAVRASDRTAAVVAAPAPSPAVARIAGAERVATAAAVAAYGWSQAPVVLLARADLPADALAGASLAGALDAPLLLTASDALSAPTRDALVALGAREVVVLGGRRAVSDAALADLPDGVRARRLAGSDRAATAAAIATEVGPAPDGVAVLVGGDAWPDALAVAGLAASRRWPVLVAADPLPAATRAALLALAPRELLVVGGPQAVSERAATAAAELVDARVRRIAGTDRYATSRAVASLVGDGPVVAATGADFPDGLAAGPLAARLGAALLLLDPARATPAPWCPTEVVAVGGPQALPDVTVDALRC